MPDHGPSDFDREDTGRISCQLHAQVAASDGIGNATPAGGTMTPDAFLDVLADRVAGKVNGKNGHSNGRMFLGLDRGGWTKLLVAWVVGAIVTLGAWHLAVRDALQVRPTAPQIEKSMGSAFSHHDRSAEAHPPIQRRLETIDSEQTTIRNSQIRQETIDTVQTEVLKEIKSDVKRLRRRAP